MLSRLFFLLGIVCALTVSSVAFAQKQVYSPIVHKGELEIETTGVYNIDHRKEKNAEQEYKMAVGYGVTDRWATEFYGEFERETGENDEGATKLNRMKFTHLEWENRYQLTEQGKYWLDAGVYFAYEIPLRAKDPGKVEGKLLLEKSTQNFTHLANLIIEKEVGGGSTSMIESGVAWSSRYRMSKHLQPGFEYWADFGEVRERLPFQEQKHQLGPVFYGNLTPQIKYDVGYLFGISRAAAQGAIKWNLEYEVKF